MITKVPFSVDVHLLSELGERLVGRPAIAVGELVKNAYDADASVVTIEFRHDEILVTDDGHGMSLDDLRDGFLRVGTGRKERRRFSPGQRRMTGSKGVGRLASQMLGRQLVLDTCSAGSPPLRIDIDWDDKHEGDDLTSFTARLEEGATPSMVPTARGTAIRIMKLTRRWTAKDIEELARDVWMLRSPFDLDHGPTDGFAIVFKAEQEEFEESFERVLRGWFELYEARVTGELHEEHAPRRGEPDWLRSTHHVHLTLVFAEDGEPVTAVVPVPSAALGEATFEVRIYKLQGRQPLGLKVADVREYLNTLGGVYLYDEGFQLPYYGPDTDWLGIEMDHAHRLTVSKVLPPELQVSGGLTFLPTTSRLFGAVHVSTSTERERVESGFVDQSESLQIQLSRDRLLDTEAFMNLKNAVRAGLDLYAHEKMRRKLRDAEERLKEANQQAGASSDPLELLELVRHELTPDSANLIEAAIVAEREVLLSRVELQERRAAALGPLATAGMVALLMEHEQARLLPRLIDFVDTYETSPNPHVHSAADAIGSYVEDMEALRPLLRSVMEPENRERSVLGARSVVQQSRASVEALLRGIQVDIEIDRAIRLPAGSLAEWSALFQNVFLNAANAVIGVDSPRIRVIGRGGSRSLSVLDNGTGIDLGRAEQYFEPFARGDQQLPAERRLLGMGGTGLGLAIVRTIAEAAGATASFEPPPTSWSTAFVLRW